MAARYGEVRRIWCYAGLRLVAWLAAAAAVGALLGHITLALLIALSLYTAGHLLFAYQLHRWLVEPRVEPIEGAGVWQDIHTELYRLKQRNRRRKRRLKHIVAEFQASTAALPDGAVVLDGRGRIIWFNNAAAALLALRAGQDNGQRLVNLLRHPRVSAFLNERSDTGTQLEIPAPTNDADTLSLRIVPYGAGQRLLIARDVSDQKRLESTRRDFVSNASHELRTPLTVLRGYLDMMAGEADDDAALSAWRKPIKEMETQATRMAGIIDSLLGLARLEGEGVTQAQATIDMAALIHRQVAEMQATDAGRHRWSVEVDDALFLFGRQGEIESVVSNLLANAVRYTPADCGIEVAWRANGAGAVFEVSDDGPGIAAEHLPRLTERFYRVDAGRSADHGGTGLGLAIVKHSLEHHDAELRIESTPGQGSRFACVFPARRRVQRAAA